MALRKFKEFIQDHERPVSRRLELNVLKEETDDSRNYGCSDGYNWQRVVGERTEVADGRFSNWHKEDERTWGHNYSNGRGVGVSAAKGIKV